MCFSVEASVAVGVALLPAGAYAVATALKKNRAYLPFAIMPLLFGVQQLCEAGVWFGLEQDSPALVKPASLAYLFFAVAFWPFWVPLAAAVVEHRPAWRLLFFIVAGVGLALGLLCYVPSALNFDEWVEVRIVHHSIRYDISAMPLAQIIASQTWSGLYLVGVCCPLLFSRDWQLRFLGLAIAISAVVSHAFFWYAFASVWCLFAAALSLHICYVLYQLPEPIREVELAHAH